MTTTMKPTSSPWKGVLIRLTLEEKARLREVLSAQGVSSMSGYFRQLAVQYIKTAGMGQDVELNHED
jgi:hypothetical protein